MSLVVPVIVAGALALFGYVVLEGLGVRAWLPAACRGIAWASIALLALNPSCRVPGTTERPLALLDASLSMSTGGGRWEEARAAASAAGDVVTFGDPDRTADTTPSAGRTLLTQALAAAGPTGRPITIVSDGEIADVATAPPDLLRSSTVRLFPRPAGPAAAVTSVTGPSRALPTDTIRLRVEVRTGRLASERSIPLVVGLGDREVGRETVVLPTTGTMTGLLPIPASRLGPGEHLLEISLGEAVDPEPRDDRRFHYIQIAPTPGVVLLASPPSWDSRFLLSTLRQVTSLPVEGFMEVSPGRWLRMSDLDPVAWERVRSAYQSADLGIRLGRTPPIASPPNREWRWPAAGVQGQAGDWYVAPGGASPLAGSMATFSVDSFAPATSVVDDTLPNGTWVALTAQLRRRGTARPVLIGRESGSRREVTSLATGWWRWAFRGGQSEQAYRAMIAGSIDWLLAGTTVARERIAPLRRVVPNGFPVAFMGSGRDDGVVPIELVRAREGSMHTDTLRFVASGSAAIYLEPGVYRYRIAGAPGPDLRGVVAVEEYSEEFFPRPVVLTEGGGAVARTPARRGTREFLWPFGLALVALSLEWGIRRRRGLR